MRLGYIGKVELPNPTVAYTANDNTVEPFHVDNPAFWPGPECTTDHCARSGLSCAGRNQVCYSHLLHPSRHFSDRSQFSHGTAGPGPADTIAYSAAPLIKSRSALWT